MEYRVGNLISIWIILITISRLKSSNAQLATAMFVFGDSLVDVGNNNCLTLTIAKGNHAYYGIDFPTHSPTGRFSNGLNAADLLANKIGLPSPPPYLDLVNMKSTDFASGINFASAGAGVLNSTNQFINPPIVGTNQLSRFTISMDEQVEYYTEVHKILVQKLGQSGAAQHLAESLFVIVIGSTDIGEYLASSRTSPFTKANFPQHINLMLSTFKRQLKRMYDHGGRKFVAFGIGPVGCVPSNRVNTEKEACDEVTNYWATKYNEGLQVLLQEFKSKLDDFQYSYINSFDLFLNFIERPLAYGFNEVKVACCGLGRLNADTMCYPISMLCSNRSDHVFWDLYHPSESATRIFVEAAFDAPLRYAFPVNIRQLAST